MKKRGCSFLLVVVLLLVAIPMGAAQTPVSAAVADAATASGTVEVPPSIKGSLVHWLITSKMEYLNKKLQPLTSAGAIRVKLIYANPDTVAEKLVSMIAAGDSPDVAPFIPNHLKYYQPLNAVDLLDLEGGGWDTAILRAFTYKNNLLAVSSPAHIGGNFIVWNKLLFSRYNVEAPHNLYNCGKWSLDSFADCMQRLYECPGVDGASLLKNVLLQCDADIVQFDGERCAPAAGDETVAICRRVSAMAACFDALNWEDFAAGEVPMAILPFQVENLPLFQQLDASDFSVVPLPAYGYGFNQKRTAALGTAYGIPKGAKNLQGAGYLLKYYLDESDGAYAADIENEEIRDQFRRLDTYSFAVTRYTPESAVYSALSAITDPEEIAATIHAQQSNVDAWNTQIQALLYQYRIHTSSSNEQYGTVSASCWSETGKTVTVTATPASGCRFDGWYEEGAPASGEAAYTFTVTGNRTLEARFSLVTAYAFGDANCDGSIDIRDLVWLQSVMEDGIYSAVCDLNRDGRVDAADRIVLHILLLHRA